MIEVILLQFSSTLTMPNFCGIIEGHRSEIELWLLTKWFLILIERNKINWSLFYEPPKRMCDGTAARLEQKQALSLWAWDKYLKMPFHYVQGVFLTFKFGFLLKCVSDKSTCYCCWWAALEAQRGPGNGSREWLQGMAARRHKMV